jgi:activator of HSP90 ATPase
MARAIFSGPAKYDLEHNLSACSHALTHEHEEDVMNELTRRQMASGIALAFCSLATAGTTLAEAPQQTMQEKPATAANRARTSLHEEIELKAAPQRIYDVLLDAKQFAAFTAMPAEIDPKPGGAFSMFGGQITGRNIELVPGQRIVQAWRPTHWDPGIYSIVAFVFKPKAGGTLVVLDHKGFPEGDFDHLEWGWHNHYWDPLKKFLS